MENKYFTPDIGDIRVGYECEIKPTGSDVDWMPYVINGDNAFRHYETKGRGATSIRVPYLTKEQIEAEEWKFTGKAVRQWFEKEGHFDLPISPSHRVRKYILQLDEQLRGIKISGILAGDTEEDIFFEGECKDINTFRYICKLLKIN